jgi:hypothetical protein
MSEVARPLSEKASLADKVGLQARLAGIVPLAVTELPPRWDADLDADRGYVRLINLTAPLR